MNALASLSESERKTALDRFRLLQPHLEEQRLLKAVAREAGIGYRTAQRWKMRYRKYGLPGLARDNRSDRGWRRAITLVLPALIHELSAMKSRSRFQPYRKRETRKRGVKKWPLVS
jgi:putative transposase